MEPDVSEKFSFAKKRAKSAENGPNMDFFVNFSKLYDLCFLIFFTKLGDQKHSKSYRAGFFLGRFSFAQKRAKSVKNALKITFLIILKIVPLVFRIFFV